MEKNPTIFEDIRYLRKNLASLKNHAKYNTSLLLILRSDRGNFRELEWNGCRIWIKHKKNIHWNSPEGNELIRSMQVNEDGFKSFIPEPIQVMASVRLTLVGRRESYMYKIFLHIIMVMGLFFKNWYDCFLNQDMQSSGNGHNPRLNFSKKLIYHPENIAPFTKQIK